MFLRQKAVQNLMNQLFDPVSLGTTWAGDVEDSYLILVTKLPYLRSPIIALSDMQARFVNSLGICRGKKRSAGKFSRQRHDQGCIGITDIPLCALPVMGLWRFVQTISLRDHAVFGTPAFGAPAAMRNAMFDRPIKGRTVNSGLSSGQDLFEKHDRHTPAYQLEVTGNGLLKNNQSKSIGWFKRCQPAERRVRTGSRLMLRAMAKQPS